MGYQWWMAQSSARAGPPCPAGPATRRRGGGGEGGVGDRGHQRCADAHGARIWDEAVRLLVCNAASVCASGLCHAAETCSSDHLDLDLRSFGFGFVSIGIDRLDRVNGVSVQVCSAIAVNDVRVCELCELCELCKSCGSCHASGDLLPGSPSPRPWQRAISRTSRCAPTLPRAAGLRQHGNAQRWVLDLQRRPSSDGSSRHARHTRTRQDRMCLA